MIGNPKYKINDKVEFEFFNKTLIGEIYIVDKYGTFEDNSDVSYDIYVKEVNTLYKHINEKYVLRNVE